MNRGYRVIWSEVKHAHVVVSEMAKRQTKGASSKAVKTALVATVGMSLLLGGYTANAAPATNPAGEGPGVAIGTGSNAQRDGVVAIGKGAHTNYAGGSGYANVNGDVAIGENATTHSYYDQSGSVAIGKNSYVENTIGRQDKLFAFKQTTFNRFGYGSLPQEPDKLVTGVAVGDNTYVRTGGTMIGSHNYRGKIGDITINTDTYAEKRKAGLGLYSTTIGANSFTNGTVATTSGALNVISSDYDGNDALKATKNFGATITGSLNSIESATSNDNVSGLANAVVGTANRTFNSNGSLIFGAGNEITNSIAAVDTSAITGSVSGGPNSVADMARDLRTLVTKSESGGSTLAIGGGNKADYTQRTSIIGVNNTIRGTSGNVAKLNSVSGFKNTVTNASNTIVMGNDHTVTANNTIAIGGLSLADTRSVANTTSIGYDAKVSKEGGVALGYKSNATVDKGAAGYDPVTGAASTETNPTWKATSAAVSVGDVENGITRQITSVAAGTADTDAVNVAQLKKAVAGASDGNDTLVSSANGLSLSGNTLSMNVTDTAGNAVTGSVDLSAIAGSVDTRNTVTAGDNVTIDETSNTDGSSTYKINVTADGQVANGNTGIVTGGTVYNETHVTNDGSYVKADNTAGQNLSILDSQVKNNADNISNLDTRVTHIGNSLTKLGDRVDRVGAGAAALAALHPQDFDPDDKWDFAAGYGNYKDAHAVAVGAFYRPNEDTMFSVGGSFGGGENMVNAGVTFKLGQHNHVSRSRVALAKDVLELKQIVARQDAMIQTLMSGKVSTVAKDVNFPDVPKDHWAYDYVKSLADKGYLEGYPDGEFKGDRAMTRYEYATVIYRALQNGAPNDADMSRAVEEFKPELAKVQEVERFRVDRISGKDTDRHKVERVRVNDKNDKAAHELRDVYGSRIPK